MPKPDRIKWDEGSGPGPNARHRLPRLVSAYFAQGRELLAANPKPAEWHALRLATKRLRYTLELFRPCYGPGLRTRLAALRRLQQFLGEVNDCATAAAILRKMAGARSASLARAERFLEQRSESRMEAFRREWTQGFDAPGQELWWTAYLARHARAPGGRAAKAGGPASTM